MNKIKSILISLILFQSLALLAPPASQRPTSKPPIDRLLEGLKRKSNDHTKYLNNMTIQAKMAYKKFKDKRDPNITNKTNDIIKNNSRPIGVGKEIIKELRNYNTNTNSNKLSDNINSLENAITEAEKINSPEKLEKLVEEEEINKQVEADNSMFMIKP